MLPHLLCTDFTQSHGLQDYGIRDVGGWWRLTNAGEIKILSQGFRNPGRQIAVATEFCTVAPKYV
jgi:hypothetical protein